MYELYELSSKFQFGVLNSNKHSSEMHPFETFFFLAKVFVYIDRSNYMEEI